MIKLNKGFTMMELVMVVAIMAVVAAIGVPSMSSFVADLQTQAKAEGIYNSLLKAKSVAMKRNIPIKWTFNDVNGEWSFGCAVVNTNVNSSAYCPDAVMEKFVLGGEKVDIDYATNGDYVVFSGIGSSIADPTGDGDAQIDVVKLSSEKGKQELWINITTGGNLSICDPNSTQEGKQCIF